VLHWEKDMHSVGNGEYQERDSRYQGSNRNEVFLHEDRQNSDSCGSGSRQSAPTPIA